VISETGLCLTYCHVLEDFTNRNNKFKQSANVTIGGYLAILKYKDDKLDIVNNNYFFFEKHY
jgi:hypothetical protein